MSERPIAPSPAGRRLPHRACLVVAVAILVIATLLAARATRPVGETGRGQTTHGVRLEDDPLRRTSRDAETLRRFAINLLLLPLIDDDVPPRWADLEEGVGCLDAAPIRVDGRPLTPGARLPARNFVVERHLSACPLLDGGGFVDGAVTMHVIADDSLGLTAVVETHDLRTTSGSGGSLQLARRFAAAETQSGEISAADPVRDDGAGDHGPADR